MPDLAHISSILVTGGSGFMGTNYILHLLDTYPHLMVHNVDRLLDTLTEWYAISPGDCVWTGTPEGVGRMYPGDIIECEMANSEGAIVSKLIGKCEI